MLKFINMDSTKQISFYEAVFRAKVAQICDSVGFHAITLDSSNILVDLYRRTIYHLARHCKDSANNNGRTEATFVDLRQAYDFIGISIQELQEHIDTTKLPFNFPIAQDEESKPSNRIQRNLHIDDLLEAEKNSQIEDQEDTENKALSDAGDDEERSTVPLLKDTFSEIANQFENITPVSADKKIRLGGRIVLLPGTKIKISTPIPPEPEPSTSANVVVKPVKEKEKKKKIKVEKLKATVKSKATPSPAKATKGKKKKKISKEFVNENSPDDDRPIPEEKLQVDHSIASKKGVVKKIKLETPPPIIAEPETQELPPPPPPPPQEDIKPVVLPELPIPSPKASKESKGKRKKRTSDEIVMSSNDIATVQLKEIPKTKPSKKKLKTAITPLDPSAAEPPSFFPILQPKVEDLALVDDDELIVPQPTIPTAQAPKPLKGKKKKKKSSENQFAIVTETVTQAEEKEWFCPACGGPDDGDLMVQCDVCQEWYHLGCTDLKKPPEENESWECDGCINKAKAQHKRPPSVDVLKTKTVIKTEPMDPVPVPELTQPTPPPLVAPAPGTSQDDLCPECNLPDNGTLMIQCDDPFCAKWFHGKCVNLLEAPKEDESWFCKVCVEKQQSAFKRRRRAK